MTDEITSVEESQVVGGVPHKPIAYKDSPTARDELRHSVHLHLMIMNGPTQQLAVFLTKTLDLIPDPGEETYDFASNDVEMGILAYSIIEALALHVQRSVDDRAARAQQRGEKFPVSVRQKGDEILVVVGKTRSSGDQVTSKNAVLKAIADALHALATVTKAKYPEIRTARGQVL
jgi:hypothetical protein